jgi:hypothetical protein
VNFGLLFFEQADEFVVLLDGFERLDVDGLAGGAGAVDDAGDAALELGADGDDEAVAADGDEVFLGCAVGGELAQGGAEGFFNDALLALLLAADAVQFGEASSASEPSGWMVRSMDSASGRRLCGERRRRARRGRGACRRGAPGAIAAGIARRRRRWRGGRRPGVRRLRGLRRGFAGFGGELRGVEEAAERDGDLFGEDEAEFGGELMLKWRSRFRRWRV